MSPPVFVVVWVAAWAVAWWVARPRVRWVTGVCAAWSPAAGRYCLLDGVRRVPGWRHLAPVVATAVAFACDVAWAVLS